MFLLGRPLAALVAVLLLLQGCAEDGHRDAFQRLANEPVMLGKAWERDLTSQEPLRPLSKALIGKNDPLARLGGRLFNDGALAADGRVSCAACHRLTAGGDDGLQVSMGVANQQGTINAPTVLNAAFNFRQFWNGRAHDLAEQARAPVVNPVEMGATWEGVVERIGSQPDYRAQFAEAFGDHHVTPDRIVEAIAHFERRLITPAPFDEFLLGDINAISEQARAGYGLFKSYGCVACHQGINVGGNLYQKFGALASAAAVNSTGSRGRVEVSKRERDDGVFKVPSLRNVAHTAPYFHNGTVTALEDAVRIMAALQLGRELDDGDVEKIVAFLQSLSGSLPRDVGL